MADLNPVLNAKVAPVQLSYGSGSSARGPRVWAAAIVLLTGLALIALGGCFLIGVMAMTVQNFIGPGVSLPSGAAAYLLILVLYVMAFACFAGAVAIIIAGLRGMIVIGRGQL